jgi:hypothetical protein
MRSHNWGTLFSGRPRSVTYGLAISAIMSAGGAVAAVSSILGLPGAATLLGPYSSYSLTTGQMLEPSRGYGVVILVWSVLLWISIYRASSPHQIARLSVIGLTGVTGLFAFLTTFSAATGRGVAAMLAVSLALWLPCVLLLTRSANDYYEDLDFR